VRGLTKRHEQGRAASWSVDDAPPEFHAGQLRAIVGIELLIDRVEAKFKMSQNRRERDIDGVVAGLAADGLETVSEVVDRLRPTT
jgi:transcriptional regulator